MQDSKWSGFYKLSRAERLARLNQQTGLTGQVPDLPIEVAEQMVENVIACYSLPLGLAVNFVINDHEYIIPMAVEEPSVIAAASHGAKILGNIRVSQEEKTLVGQIIIENLPNIPQAMAKLMDQREELLTIARSYSQSMVNRGGGPREIRFEQKQNVMAQYLCCYLSFDPCDAMGANAINTVLEGLCQPIEEISSGKVLMAILSNYNETSLTRAQVSLPFKRLGKSEAEGEHIAKQIQKASDYAKIDPYRATTHNKGIMNGIDGVVLATGNDLRATSASAHAYAARLGHYQPLSTWEIRERYLYGELEIPLPLATVGGSLASHPTAQWVLDVLGRPSAKELAMIATAVGLAQNFSALKALVTDGIQKGHMTMQARNLLMQVGAKPEEVSQVVKALVQEPRMNSQIALEVLKRFRGQK